MKPLTIAETVNSGVDLSEEYNKELCEERHERIEKQIDALFNRLNWGIGLLIATLATAIANFIK